MARFSERIGVDQSDRVLQVDSMDDALRNSLWNLLFQLYDNGDHWKSVAKCVAIEFRKSPADELPYEALHCRDWLKEYFSGLPWAQAYDLFEFLVTTHGSTCPRHKLCTQHVILLANDVLERELSAYRFVQEMLTPISDPIEVVEVEAAVDAAGRAAILGAQQHIRTALGLFGKKPDPDYRNAIKEAISAVESVAKVLSRDESTTLDPALSKLADKVGIHGALKSGFSKLYGFTSDEDGIRHAILEQSSVGFAEAKYMIVACSAFVHYLITKADEAGLLNK